MSRFLKIVVGVIGLTVAIVRGCESEAWTESLAELGRAKHRVVEFLDPERKRAGLWAVIAERNAKVVALAWLDARARRRPAPAHGGAGQVQVDR